MSHLDDIRAQFASAGVRGWLHATPVADTEPQVAVDADDVVVMASVYKLPVLVAFARAVDDAVIDPSEPVLLPPSERTVGETGVSAMSDPVTMSWRDLARSMIAMSDNAAGDALLIAIGLERVGETLRVLGARFTHVRGGTTDLHRLLTEDLGAHDVAEAMESVYDNDRLTISRAFDPLLSSATTPRDMTALLSSIWSDTAASPEQCQFMRTVLRQQIWPHRLSSGFSYPGVRVAGKTGTLGALRHEVGVVEHRHEPALAVAVFTHAARADRNLPQVDAVIGSAARTAVTAMRWGDDRGGG